MFWLATAGALCNCALAIFGPVPEMAGFFLMSAAVFVFGLAALAFYGAE